MTYVYEKNKVGFYRLSITGLQTQIRLNSDALESVSYKWKGEVITPDASGSVVLVENSGTVGETITRPYTVDNATLEQNLTIVLNGRDYSISELNPLIRYYDEWLTEYSSNPESSYIDGTIEEFYYINHAPKDHL